MSFQIDNIIPVTTRIRPGGLAMANFASAVLFAPFAEQPKAPSLKLLTVDSFVTYNSLKALSVDFPDTTETYKAAAKWLGGTPTTREVRVYTCADADATITATLNKARNKSWWYFSLFTKGILAVPATVQLIADWCETNESFFPNCQTGVECAKIRTPGTDTDIASILTKKGYRYSMTIAHATDAYAGYALMKHYAAVNYSADKSTITGEYKKSPSVEGENLDDDEYAAMMLPTKRVCFYTQVTAKDSVDTGRWMNTITHSTYGEWADDVINLSAFSNSIQVSEFNTMANALTKLGQDPVGQAMIISGARVIGVRYIDNDYLGPRMYTDPDDGQEKYTEGFEIMTKPDDILWISDEERARRAAAPMRIRLFRKGAIHIVDMAIEVY